MKRFLPFLVLALAFVVGVRWISEPVKQAPEKNATPTAEAPSPSVLVQDIASVSVPSIEPVNSDKPESSIDFALRTRAVNLAPTPDSLRREVEANPHGTPSGLLQFATQMGYKREAAEKDQKDPDGAMKRFREEVLECKEKALSSTVRAYCDDLFKDLSKGHETP